MHHAVYAHVLVGTWVDCYAHAIAEEGVQTFHRLNMISEGGLLYA